MSVLDPTRRRRSTLILLLLTSITLLSLDYQGFRPLGALQSGVRSLVDPVVAADDRVDGMLRIESGVEPEDLVVVRGIQRARPGAKVAPQEVEMATLATSAGRSPAGEPAEEAGESGGG